MSFHPFFLHRDRVMCSPSDGEHTRTPIRFSPRDAHQLDQCAGGPTSPLLHPLVFVALTNFRHLRPHAEPKSLDHPFLLFHVPLTIERLLADVSHKKKRPRLFPFPLGVQRSPKKPTRVSHVFSFFVPLFNIFYSTLLHRPLTFPRNDEETASPPLKLQSFPFETYLPVIKYDKPGRCCFRSRLARKPTRRPLIRRPLFHAFYLFARDFDGSFVRWRKLPLWLALSISPLLRAIILSCPFRGFRA